MTYKYTTSLHPTTVLKKRKPTLKNSFRGGGEGEQRRERWGLKKDHLL